MPFLRHEHQHALAHVGVVDLPLAAEIDRELTHHGAQLVEHFARPFGRRRDPHEEPLRVAVTELLALGDVALEGREHAGDAMHDAALVRARQREDHAVAAGGSGLGGKAHASEGTDRPP